MNVMQTDLKHCPECHGPLIEIDYYGLRLIGCVECNCWGWSGDERLLMEVAEEDMDALRKRVRRAKQAG
jgi:hypothetical protein